MSIDTIKTLVKGSVNVAELSWYQQLWIDFSSDTLNFILTAGGIVGAWAAKGAFQAILEQWKSYKFVKQESNEKLNSYRSDLQTLIAGQATTLETLSGVVHEKVIPHMAISRDNQKDIQDSISSLRGELREPLMNSLDPSVSISTVLTYIGNLNLELMIWYEDRVRENNIVNNLDIITKRYETQQDKIISKLNAQLSKYSNLAPWITPEGAEVMSRFLIQSLLSLQYNMATGKPSEHESARDILERWQSIWGDACRAWTTKGEGLEEWANRYIKELDKNNSGKVEFL